MRLADFGLTALSYTYHHLGQLTQVTDDAGTRTIGYNQYGEQETDSLLAGNVTHLITETRDAMGRSTGFVYAKDGIVQHTVMTDYASDGRINSAGFVHEGEEKVFRYDYLPGSNLLHCLTHPNGVTLMQTFEAKRDLITEMLYINGNQTAASRRYEYDSLRRPTTRYQQQEEQTQRDSFEYNTRSELSAASLGIDQYKYRYDNIGNRILAEGKAYTTNELNQYASVGDFVPQFDVDGNQTLLKTETGVWQVEYNAENRPVRFTRIEGISTTVVECAYDTYGRRTTKKVTVNGAVTLHQRYIYRGYLQIACLDITRSNHPALWYITWDPTQAVATRPLAIQLNDTWCTYGWDLTKNICEAYRNDGCIRTVYNYSPYGAVISNGEILQFFLWSSEVYDSETGLTYYNNRYLNHKTGRWINRDRYRRKFSKNLYDFANNCPIKKNDILGHYVFAIDGTNFDVQRHSDIQYSFVYDFHRRCFPSEESVYQGGPGSVYASEGILDATGFSVDYVLKKIKKIVCKKHCANPTEKLNFVGWSRGAIIAQDLVRDLDINGCCCKDRIRKNIQVNFLGLYDAVARTPHRNENPYKPANVKHYVHVYNTKQSWMFKTYFPEERDKNQEEYDKENNIYPGKRLDGEKSQHGDIGGAHDAEYTNAHSIIVNWAKNSGVAIDNRNLDKSAFDKEREKFKK